MKKIPRHSLILPPPKKSANIWEHWFFRFYSAWLTLSLVPFMQFYRPYKTIDPAPKGPETPVSTRVQAWGY